MEHQLKIYNSLRGKKELFVSLVPKHVGMYSCGPTVYNEVHLGNLRTFITFDVVFRYLKYLEYNVRYVRNITDAGHLTNDAGEGVDRIEQSAKLEQLEPMEIVQKYTNSFHEVCSIFNLLPPSIEPTATGHIVEQIEMVKRIMKNGYAYESNNSIYFDVRKYMEKHKYGELSGRKVDELLEGTRDLDGQEEKKNQADFAIWKSVAPNHLQRWVSPWGEGIPGWHLECSAMSVKYLGKTFDIHGGGMDLKFPHHECEIAQSVGADGVEPARYWMHTNMLTVNGEKMSKSKGNSFLPRELINGSVELLDYKAYSPMCIRFFMLQGQYRSTLDFSKSALNDAETNYKELARAHLFLSEIKYDETKVVEFDQGRDNMLSNFRIICRRAMEDDFNTVKVLSEMLAQSHNINVFRLKIIDVECVRKETFESFREDFNIFFTEILGLKSEENVLVNHLMALLIDLRKDVRSKKDFAASDKIRDRLSQLGIKIEDGKAETFWTRIKA